MTQSSGTLLAKVEQPLTWRFWIVSIVLTAILTIMSFWWVLFQSGQCLLSLSLLAGLSYYMPLVFMSLFFMVIISQSKKFVGKINVHHMVYLYTILAGLAWIGTADPIFIPAVYWVSCFAHHPAAIHFMPWWFGPQHEIAIQLISGGVPIPWLAYIPSMLWWWWIFALWALFMIGLAGILRRHWVDVEQVPFPHVVVAYDLIRSIEPEFRTHLRSWKFLIGMMLSCSYVVLMFLIVNFPWFPDIYGWRTNTCPSGLTYITPASPLNSIIALSGSTKNPLNTAIFYIAPLTTLFNIWFWWLILAILCQAAYALGFYTGASEAGGCGRVYFCPDISIVYQPPFVWQVFVTMGMVTGIVLSYIIVNRRYIAETIKTALGRQTVLKNLEDNEPFRYRTGWLLCIITMILLIISFMMCGISFAPALILVLITILYALCWTRAWGLGGFWASTGFYGAPGFFKWIWPVAPEPLTQEWLLTMQFAILPASNTPYQGWGHYLISTLASSRLASLTKTSQRNVFKTSIVASLITPITAMVAFISWSYVFGFTKAPQYYGIYGHGGLFELETVASFVNPMPAVGIWWPHAIAGIITAMVIYYLHTRFVWFPFEPVGMMIGIDPWSMLLALWQHALIAWILKSLTFKIGGSKAYEEHGVPVAVGFIVGYALAVLFIGIVGIYRFFFPF
ncbi:MAG: DUF6785 family protein [Nitrososphaerota archaeon]